MDKIAVTSLVVGIVGALAAVVAAVFAGMAPTKKDLQRVEEHTETTSKRLEKVQTHIASVDNRLNDQHAYELLISKAQRVSITVEGDDKANSPLRIYLTLKDPESTLSQIELFNETGTLFGSALCATVEPLLYVATIESVVVRRWFNGGTPDQSANRQRLRMRACMLLEGQEVYRDFAVHIVEITRQYQGVPYMETAFIVEGFC